MLTLLLSDPSPLDQLTNLGAAGIMGLMWLWERRTSRQREQQLDAAHDRIMADRVQLDQLIELVRQNTQALARFTSTQQQLLTDLASDAKRCGV